MQNQTIKLEPVATLSAKEQLLRFIETAQFIGFAIRQYLLVATLTPLALPLLMDALGRMWTIIRRKPTK